MLNSSGVTIILLSGLTEVGEREASSEIEEFFSIFTLKLKSLKETVSPSLPVFEIDYRIYPGISLPDSRSQSNPVPKSPRNRHPTSLPVRVIL